MPPRLASSINQPKMRQYAGLTHFLPFDFSSKRDPMDVILNDDVVPIRKRVAEIPKPLAAAIDRAVTINHKDRYPDAIGFFKAVE